jgi:saccharopine dehydrogenase-like NADP-dependent oxidoreductase
MKVLLVGVGGVGEMIAVTAAPRPFVEKLVLADFNFERAKEVQGRLPDAGRFPVEHIDARDRRQVIDLARKYQVDLVMNACDPSVNEPLFDAAFDYGCTYMDMAMTLAVHHPADPYHQAHIKLGDYQFERHEQWLKKGQLAVLGLGIDPGASDIFARYAQDHLFDEIEEVGVRDCANLEVEGYDFAPGFSVWTTIDECLNPPVVWEAGRGWYTTQPFSEAEKFPFPEGIGLQEVVNVEHEEVMLIPRWIRCKKVTFKYGLGDKFINVLKTLHMLGMDNKHPIPVKGVQVAPRDVVVACLPDPAHLGDRMKGKTCVGTWVKGIRGGRPREVYVYQSSDNEECMQRFGCQAVVAQTGFNPVIGWELLENGSWSGAGVLGPEAFDPLPFLAKMADYGFPWNQVELDPTTHAPIQD